MQLCEKIESSTSVPHYFLPFQHKAHLTHTLHSADASSSLLEILQDSSILGKCNLLLKFNKNIVNKHASEGPVCARLAVYANTPASEANVGALLVR